MLCIVIVIAIILVVYAWFYFSPHVREYIVTNVFSQMKYGNIRIMCEGKAIYTLNSDLTKDVPVMTILNKEKFFKNLYKHGEMGLGKSYVKKYWTTSNLLDCLMTFALNENVITVPNIFKLSISDHKPKDDHKKIKHHYDVGNDFYDKILLDELSAYSCGFWQKDDTLNDAQFRKVNTIIKKMDPVAGSNILDIGCGWGKIAKYVSEKTNCNVDGITLSDEQLAHSIEHINNDKVHIYKTHYTNLTKMYDYIYSIGMFEHVRYENYDTFFECIKQILKPNGRMVLHTIIDVKSKDPQYVDKSFISEYIFPGGQIPNNDWITTKINQHKLMLIHGEIYGGQHYARTLHEWYDNMYTNKDYIIGKYGEELFRRYEYYFKICEVGFATGKLALGHYIISNNMIGTLSNSYL